MKAASILALVLALAITGCNVARTTTTDGSAYLRTMQAIDGEIDTPMEAKFRRLSTTWSSTFEPRLQDLQALSNPEMQAAFSATSMLVYYAVIVPGAKAEDRLDLLQSLHRELQVRGSVSTEQTIALFEHLVTLRRFDDAKQLKQGAPALAHLDVPAVHFAAGFDASLPATMRLREDGAWDVANVSMFDFGVVAVVGCPTSADAVAALGADSKLMRSIQQAKVVWLADASVAAHPHVAAAWNRELPDQPLHVAWRNATWEGVDMGAMPNFHYLRNGRVIELHTGWDPGQTPAQVRSALANLKNG